MYPFWHMFLEESCCGWQKDKACWWFFLVSLSFSALTLLLDVVVVVG